MKAKFLLAVVFLMALFWGCGGEKPTEPEDTLHPTSPEFTAFLNTQAGRQFAEAPWDVNQDGKIDVLDLMMVAQHFGEDVEVGVQGELKEGAVLRIINSNAATPTIQVTGYGSAFGEPDIVVLNLGVSVQKGSVKEAREEAAQAMQKVLSEGAELHPLFKLLMSRGNHPHIDTDGVMAAHTVKLALSEHA